MPGPSRSPAVWPSPPPSRSAGVDPEEGERDESQPTTTTTSRVPHEGWEPCWSAQDQRQHPSVGIPAADNPHEQVVAGFPVGGYRRRTRTLSGPPFSYGEKRKAPRTTAAATILSLTRIASDNSGERPGYELLLLANAELLPDDPGPRRQR